MSVMISRWPIYTASPETITCAYTHRHETEQLEMGRTCCAHTGSTDVKLRPEVRVGEGSRFPGCGQGPELRIDFDDGRLQSRQLLIRVFLGKAFLWDDGE